MPPQNRYDVSEAVSPPGLDRQRTLFSPPATTTGHVRVDETEATALMLHQSALVCGDARRALQLRRSGGSGPRHSLGTGDALGPGYGPRIPPSSPAGRASIFASHNLCTGIRRGSRTLARLSRPVRLRPGDDP